MVSNFAAVRCRAPMIFHEDEPRPGIHLAGFLSQEEGSELRIFNAAGDVIESKRV